MSGLAFKAQPKLAELNSGWVALGYKMLILPREIEKKTAGGILIPEVEGNIQRQEEAGSEGVVVEMGLVAGENRWHRGAVRNGDIVGFARYSGKHAEFTGDDERTYRVMNDEDVLMVKLTKAEKEMRYAHFLAEEKAALKAA